MLDSYISLLRTVCSVAGEKRTGFDSVIITRYSTPVKLKQFFDGTTFLKCSTLSLLFFEDHFLPMVRGSARDKVVVY